MARNASSTNTGPDSGQTVSPTSEGVPVEIEEPKSTESDEKFVQYTGGATTREVMRRQWEQAGVQRQGDSRWTVANRHLLPVSDFSDAALETLLKDGSFRVVAAHEVS